MGWTKIDKTTENLKKLLIKLILQYQFTTWPIMCIPPPCPIHRFKRGNRPGISRAHGGWCPGCTMKLPTLHRLRSEKGHNDALPTPFGPNPFAPLEPPLACRTIVFLPSFLILTPKSQGISQWAWIVAAELTG